MGKSWAAVAMLVLGLVGCRGEPDSLRDLARAAHDDEDFVSVPILRTSNLDRSLAYYEQQLGFETQFTWGEPASFAGTRRGETLIFFCLECQGSGPNWMMIFVRDVRGLHDELKKRGANIVRGLVEEPWGMVEMHVEDPDGHILRFGTGTD